jgi:NifU-like protein involved in Fe-S cluster formation
MPKYSEKTIWHFEHPHRGCAPSDADLTGKGGQGGHGPFIELFLKTADGRIQGACFRSYGCPAAIAASSAICRLLEGRPLTEAAGLTVEELDAELGGLPRNKRHCLSLAMSASEDAVAKTQECQAARI